MPKGEAYSATGRRKEAVARVWLLPGSGKIQINGRDVAEYFKRATLKMLIEQPLDAVGMLGKYDVLAKARGGGLSGQAGAVRLGIARALLQASQELRPILRRGGFLTRDPRMVERKKYGQAGARKRFQFSKR